MTLTEHAAYSDQGGFWQEVLQMQRSTETDSKEMRPRVDCFGRAFAGSQRQIQTWVNLRPVELSNKTLEVLSLSPSPPPESKLRWVSPLASDRFAEYRDEEFLCVLGLKDLSNELREFWPKGGPSWDALGVLNSPSGQGFVLVEAKSHSTELQSECKAKDPESLKKIQESLTKTQAWLGVSDLEPRGWMKPFYQAANRLAHLYFLRSRGIQAWLVNVYFLNDPHFGDTAPRSPEDWNAPIEAVERALGLAGKQVRFTAQSFLEATDCY